MTVVIFIPRITLVAYLVKRYEICTFIQGWEALESAAFLQSNFSETSRPTLLQQPRTSHCSSWRQPLCHPPSLGITQCDLEGISI